MLRQTTLKTNETVAPRSMVLESRYVYGQGTVETIVHLDEGVLLIEQRSGTNSFIIPLVSPQAKERLKLFF